MQISFDGVRVAVRTLRKQPGFTSVVILSLALAIALNTTMYGVLDALIHPRVDIRDPDRVYMIRMYGDYHHRVSRAQRDSAVRSGVHNIEAIAWWDAVGSYSNAVIEAGANYAEGSVKPVSVEYFDLIGPRLIAGRTFSAADEFVTPKPIVISEQLASKLFPGGADPLGARVSFADSTYAVIGVLSHYSDFPEWRSSAWTMGKPRDKEMYSRIIRLRPGASAEEADRELTNVAQRIAAVAGEGPKDLAFRFSRPAEPQFHAQSFHYAIVLSVVAVLLVACANLANMQLARGIGRRRELALRSALGATRGRIIKHLLTESVLLAVAGLALGLVLTYWGGVALKASIPPAIGDFVVEPQLSWRVLTFALTATVACIVLVGVAPSIKVSRVDANEMLKAGAGTGATRKNRRQYGYLVGAEIALALGLLSGASLMLRSAFRSTIDVYGFDPTPIVTGLVLQTRSPLAEKRLQSELLQAAVARVSAVPGVAMASATTSGGVVNHAVTVSDSGRGVREIAAPRYSYRVVTPSFLRTIGLPIVRGRDFRDGERDEPAVIIDEYTASSLWPAANPIGALIKFGDAASNAPFVRIVGVAGLITRKTGGLPSTSEMRLGMVYYLPGPRDSVTVGGKNPSATLVSARASGDPTTLPIMLRRAGVLGARSMGEDLQRARASRAFVAKLFTLFGALGLGLAVFGVYGVVAHSVAERRRELGVRIALGASSRDILHAVLRDSVVIALAGIALGLLGSKYGVKLLAAYAFEDDLFNAPLFALAAAFLFAATAAGAFVPALRATKVDPTESLRSE